MKLNLPIDQLSLPSSLPFRGVRNEGIRFSVSNWLGAFYYEDVGCRMCAWVARQRF
jgi:hypothetical protein